MTYFENFFKQTKYVTFSFKFLELFPCAWNLLKKGQDELQYFLKRLKLTAGLILCEQKLIGMECFSSNLTKFCSKLVNLDLENKLPKGKEKKKVLHIADKIQRFEFSYFATTNRIRCYFNLDFGKTLVAFDSIETYLNPDLKSKLIREHPPSNLRIPSKIYEIDLCLELKANLERFLDILKTTPLTNKKKESGSYNPKEPFVIERRA